MKLCRAPIRSSIAALLLILASATNSHAQTEMPLSSQLAAAPKATSSAGDTAPLRAARLTYLAGEVRVQRSDNTGEDTAVLNMPLGEGTRVLTGDYGQAEIEFEDGSVARLTPRSALALNLLALDSAHIAHTEISLLGGLAYFELRHSPGYTWLVDAGGLRAIPLQNLTLRVDFTEPPAIFAVFTGSAHLERPDAFKADLNAGETLRADSEDNTRYALTAQTDQQSWDSWNESRDGAAADAADKRTAARNDFAGDQGYGWSDLDSSGNWYNVPGTGQVWQPDNADEGFDPYGYGAWVWGNGAYLWASGYSWGWTPFRCGHWQFFPSFGWGWTPNLSCGRWGFAGGGYAGDYGSGGIFIRGPYPPRHNPVVRPRPRPGPPYPIIPVHGPDGPRPWTPHSGPVRIAGTSVTPLPTLGSGYTRSGSVLGKALTLDYPVDRKTHQPILGTEPSTTTYTIVAPPTPRLTPGTRTPAYGGSPTPLPPAGLRPNPTSPATPRPTTPIRPASPSPSRVAPPPPPPAAPHSPSPPPPPTPAAPRPKA